MDQDIVEEVLFEYKGSRRAIRFNRDTICSDVEKELNVRYGLKDVRVSLCSPHEPTSSTSVDEIYILQRWSTKWDTFVDVNCTEELDANSKISVVHKPVKSPTKVSEG